MEPQHRALIDKYKFVNGVRIRERGALQLEKNLNDDYVKFIRFTQMLITRAGVGVWGLITNHSFLDNPTMRGMRWSLLDCASRLWLFDLHGNSTKKEQSPDGSEDLNVFQIKQGVAISLMVRLPESIEENTQPEVKHFELWGNRERKEDWLRSNGIGSHGWTNVEPTPELNLFVPQSASLKAEFETWSRLPDVMSLNGAGYITARDNLVIDFDHDVLLARIAKFSASTVGDQELLEIFEIADKKGWDVKRARAELKRVDIPSRVIKTNYRPFDSRWIFFDSTLVWGRSWPTMQHVVGHPTNLTMLATRLTKDQWDVWVATTVSSHKALSAYDTNSIFPLWLFDDPNAKQHSLTKGQRRLNINLDFLRALAERLGVRQEGADNLPAGISGEDIFSYAYAVLRSSEYGLRYLDLLKSDFPRLPLAATPSLFHALSRQGNELISVHLMQASASAKGLFAYEGSENPGVEKIAYSSTTVWIDRAETIGFRNVPESVWSFKVGGYQVCEKWLKDRKGAILSITDIDHYCQILNAISETLVITARINEIIESHGGWPGAFA
jgi:predicted helicase